MGVILAKFRKEKSTQEILEGLQEKIDTLETFTVNTQEQKKRIVGNFLAVSIGMYVIAFIVFYFIYFPPTWQERIMFFIPLLLFPIIIIQLRYLFTWYFQRKLNKNSQKLTALRAEKKKILEQVMDKETYKVAVNLLARFADKPSKSALTLTSTTPSKLNQPLINRSLPTLNISQPSNQLNLPSTPSTRISSTTLGTPSTPRLTTQLNTPGSPALMSHGTEGGNQQLRRRTPFPILNQQEKGVFDRIVDIVIGDGPQDRFAMICKECYSHNGMALKEDFEYTTFRCAFCNTLNPARKARPVAPRLSVMPASPAVVTDTSDSDSESADNSEDEPTNLPSININPVLDNETKDEAAPVALPTQSLSLSSDEGERDESKELPPSGELNTECEETTELETNTSLDELIKRMEKSAIEDTTP